MEPLNSLLQVASRARLPWLFPRLGVGAEGEAWLCTSDHVPILVLGAPPRPPAPLHIDVELRLWNKAPAPITVFELLRAEAAGEVLGWREPGYLGAFEEATLDVGGRRTRNRFELRPPDGEELRARPRDRLTLKLRTSRGRPLRVTLGIAEHRW